MTVIAASVSLASIGSPAAAETSGPKGESPWQHDDGTIEFKNQKFGSWQALHASRLFNPLDKCLAPDPDLQGDGGNPIGNLRGIDPGDCAYTSTTIDPAYESGVETYQIRCVVHVIRNDSGSLGNIAPDKVASGIRILNEDFNAILGTPGEPGTFANIEFVLADVDPDGNPTTGITYSDNTTWYNDGGNYWNSLNWDPTRYLNIYTTTASGALGYVSGFPSEAGFPGTAEDRVVVLWECYGDDAPYGAPFNLGRTLTHEVGHYLGLFHTFQGGCSSTACYGSGDLICDTNAESGPNFGCGTGSTCGSPDPTDNYMDYSDDACMNKFTPEQVNRMRCSLLNYRPLIFDEGGSCSTGEAGFGSAAVQPDGMVTVFVEDCDLDSDQGTIQSTTAMVYSDLDSKGFQVLLDETATDSGVFSADIEIASSPSAFALYAPEGTSIYVEYLDALDADGNPDVTVTGSADVDGSIVTPTISVGDFTASTATVMVSAFEPVSITVHYGSSCGSLTGTAGPSPFGFEVDLVLDGLEDDATYAFVVDVIDEAGNTISAPASGCDEFVLPDALEFFAEQFTGSFDLDGTSIRFERIQSADVFAPCAEEISALPIDPSGGIAISLGDDSATSVNIPFAFEYYGSSYTSVSVASNGFVVFGGSDTGYDESFPAHFESVRISLLFDDLNPSVGGNVSHRSVGDRFAITWENIPEYGTSNSNTFQVVLSSDGTVTLAWLGIDVNDAVVGLSDGGGVDAAFEPSDLSASSSGCLPRPPTVNDVAVTTQPGTAVDIALLASDDGEPQPLAIEIRSLPGNGSLRDLGSNAVISNVPYVLSSNAAPQVRFEPSGSNEFETSFLYGADDGGTPPEGGPSADAEVTIVVSAGPQELVAWDMESNPGWSLEGDWAWGSPTGGGGDPVGGDTGSNVVGFALNAEYANGLGEIHATTPSFDCTEASDTTLRFSRWLGVESSTYDHAYLRVSNDGGSSWTTIYENPSTSFEDTSWQSVEFDISGLADGESDVRLRFTMGTTDSSVTFCGWNIDDVVVEATLPSVGSPADLNGDGVVNGADVGLLLSEWGPCVGCPGDLNGDGVVDGADFGLLLAAWGGDGVNREAAPGEEGEVTARGDMQIIELQTVNEGLIEIVDGLLVVEGGYRQDVAGVLSMGVEGQEPIIEHDLMVVRGDVVLDGRLEISTSNLKGLDGRMVVLLVADRIEGDFLEIITDGDREDLEVCVTSNAVVLRIGEGDRVPSSKEVPATPEEVVSLIDAMTGLDTSWDLDGDGEVTTADLSRLLQFGLVCR